jgi:hypothetical protein
MVLYPGTSEGFGVPTFTMARGGSCAFCRSKTSTRCVTERGSGVPGVIFVWAWQPREVRIAARARGARRREVNTMI